MRVISLQLALILSLFSCKQSQTDIKVQEINEILNSAGLSQNLSDVDILFLVPNAGCDGCITMAESFIVDNIDKHQNFITIFTDTKSHKALKLKIGERVFNHDRVFIDRQNLFYSGSLMSIYPLIAYIEMGQVHTIVEVSPENNTALDNLTSQLK